MELLVPLLLVCISIDEWVWKCFLQSRTKVLKIRESKSAPINRPPNICFSVLTLLGYHLQADRVFFLLFLQAATRSKLTTYMINSHFVSQLLLRMQACAANLLSVNWAVPLNMQAWLSDWVFHSPITQISSRMWFSLDCVFKFNKCQGNLMDQVVAKPAKRGTLPLLSLFLQGDNRECL